MAKRKKQGPNPFDAVFAGLEWEDGEIEIRKLVERVKADGKPELRLNKMHEFFSVGEIASRQDDHNLREHIRRLGIQNRIIITPESEILDGRRRALRSIELGLKTIQYRRILSPITKMVAFQLAIGMQELHKPSWDEDAIFKILLGWFGKETLLADRRQNNWKNFDGLPREAEGLRLDQLLAQVWPRYTSSGWLDVLARVRRRLRGAATPKLVGVPEYSKQELETLKSSLGTYFQSVVQFKSAEDNLKPYLRDFADKGDREERLEALKKHVERKLEAKIPGWTEYRKRRS